MPTTPESPNAMCCTYYATLSNYVSLIVGLMAAPPRRNTSECSRRTNFLAWSRKAAGLIVDCAETLESGVNLEYLPECGEGIHDVTREVTGRHSCDGLITLALSGSQVLSVRLKFQLPSDQHAHITILRSTSASRSPTHNDGRGV